jgi:hypothetical protein
VHYRFKRIGVAEHPSLAPLRRAGDEDLRFPRSRRRASTCSARGCPTCSGRTPLRPVELAHTERYIRQTLARLTLLALASVLVIVSGCGGGDDSSGDVATMPASTAEGGATSSTATTTSISEGQAEELATSMLLRLSDFPTGWRAQPPSDEEGCAGLEEVTERFDALGKAESDDFVQGEATEAGSGAGLFGDEKTAMDALNYVEETIQSEEFRDCINDFLREQSDEDVTFDEVQVGQVSFPSFGDRSSAWQVVIPAQSEGLSLTVYLDVVYIVRSRAFSSLLFADFLTPFDEQLRTDLARVVSRRMDEAVSEIP